MTIEIALLISIVSAAFAVYFGLKNTKRADVSDVAKKAEETATINVKLDQIGGDVRDIKYDMSTLKRDVQELTERVNQLNPPTNVLIQLKRKRGKTMKKEKIKTWIKAAGVRAIKTVAQTAIATIGTSVVMSEVNWPVVASAAALAGLLSLLTSITGLPEIKLAESKEEANTDE